MKPRRISAVTGKRGGFGAMRPMLEMLRDDPGVEFTLIATDQHIDPKFGATLAEVKEDFPDVVPVPMDQGGDSGLERSKALGNCLRAMAAVLADVRPDILILYGDRGEVMATALAATHMRIPIAHLQGGDVSGNIDEPMRHAIAKLAHLHFTASEASSERLIKMGEEPWRVHVVGDNHVDPIVLGRFTPAGAVRERLGIGPQEQPIVVLQHPETVRGRDHYADMRATLDAVLSFDRRTLIVYPCSDPGHDRVIAAIEEARGRPGVSIHKNIDAPDFLGLLAIAAVLVGNSSAGLIETPYFPVPAVNVGQRQQDRLRSGNVVDCEMGEVQAALNTALTDPAFAEAVRTCARPFGAGDAGARIFDVLRSVPLDARLLAKRMTY